MIIFSFYVLLMVFFPSYVLCVGVPKIMKEKGFNMEDMPCKQKMQPSHKMSKAINNNIRYQLIIKGRKIMFGLLKALTKSYMMMPTTLMIRTGDMSSKSFWTWKVFKPLFQNLLGMVETLKHHKVGTPLY